ncbi:MAG: glycosyltransferase [Chryseobacterium sp.]|nr:glycosyltransferase [Chryseobacterium sp.]
MKIIYLTDQVCRHGGIEKVLSQKANYLADNSGEEVFIVTYNQQGEKPVYKFSEKIIFFDLDINYDISKSYFRRRNLLKIPKHWAALQTIFREIKPDFVISSSFGPDFYFLPYVCKNIPKIKEFHSSRYFYFQNNITFKSKVFRKINKFIEEKYHQIVVLNLSEKPFYNNRNIAVIPNPAEKSTVFAQINSKKILAAGRISPIKNFGDLIEIFSHLAADFPDWELHFFGENYQDTQEKLEVIIGQLHLESQIKFKGISDDLKKEMQNYSIYAMTSESECFPMVLLEALSVGLPVISYDAPTGPKYILKNSEDSFLIAYKNLDIFTEKLKLLIKSGNLRKKMGLSGIENVKQFDIEIVMKKWQNLFQKIKK